MRTGRWEVGLKNRWEVESSATHPSVVSTAINIQARFAVKNYFILSNRLPNKNGFEKIFKMQNDFENTLIGKGTDIGVVHVAKLPR